MKRAYRLKGTDKWSCYRCSEFGGTRDECSMSIARLPLGTLCRRNIGDEELDGRRACRPTNRCHLCGEST